MQSSENKKHIITRSYLLKFPFVHLKSGENAQIASKPLIQNKYLIIWIKWEDVPTTELNIIAANLV